MSLRLHACLRFSRRVSCGAADPAIALDEAVSARKDAIPWGALQKAGENGKPAQDEREIGTTLLGRSGLRPRPACGAVSVRRAERLVAGTAREATLGDRAGRFQGNRSQPAVGRA